MTYEKCRVCGKPFESKWSIYAKCDSCIGARTVEQIKELSVDDRIRLRFSIRKEESRCSREHRNLMENCDHPKITRRHLIYTNWEDEVQNDNIHMNDENSFVWCEVCGREFGWECPVNPKGYCEYPSNFKEEEIYECTILYCVHCKKPKNRFIDLESVRKKFSFESTEKEMEIYENSRI